MRKIAVMLAVAFTFAMAAQAASSLPMPGPTSYHAGLAGGKTQ